MKTTKRNITCCGSFFLNEMKLVRALSTLPEKFQVLARNPEKSITVEGDNHVLGPGYGSAIIDLLSREIMAVMKTAEMLKGNDNYCMNYLKGFRTGDIQA